MRFANTCTSKIDKTPPIPEIMLRKVKMIHSISL